MTVDPHTRPAPLQETPPRRGIVPAGLRAVLRHPWLLTAALLATTAAAATQIAVPFVVGRLTDALLARDADTAWTLVVAGLVIAVLGLFAGAASLTLLARLGDAVPEGGRLVLAHGLRAHLVLRRRTCRVQVSRVDCAAQPARGRTVSGGACARPGG